MSMYQQYSGFNKSTNKHFLMLQFTPAQFKILHEHQAHIGAVDLETAVVDLIERGYEAGGCPFPWPDDATPDEVPADNATP